MDFMGDDTIDKESQRNEETSRISHGDRVIREINQQSNSRRRSAAHGT